MSSVWGRRVDEREDGVVRRVIGRREVARNDRAVRKVTAVDRMLGVAALSIVEESAVHLGELGLVNLRNAI